ncbi:MAG: hypothetical protein ACE5G6_06305 [Terriglobia bacterium]
MTFALLLGTLLLAGVVVAAVRQSLSGRKGSDTLGLGVRRPSGSNHDSQPRPGERRPG